jgi:hypothetical protein
MLSNIERGVNAPSPIASFNKTSHNIVINLSYPPSLHGCLNGQPYLLSLHII